MQVIAMSCEREPLARIATGRKGRIIYVLNPKVVSDDEPDQFSGVGFPFDSVFEFDSQAFDSLKAAWEACAFDEIDRILAGLPAMD